MQRCYIKNNILIGGDNLVEFQLASMTALFASLSSFLISSVLAFKLLLSLACVRVRVH